MYNIKINFFTRIYLVIILSKYSFLYIQSDSNGRRRLFLRKNIILLIY